MTTDGKTSQKTGCEFHSKEKISLPHLEVKQKFCRKDVVCSIGKMAGRYFKRRTVLNFIYK